MTRQLSFDLPSREALGREDFFVSPANAMAVALIEGWQNWQPRKLALVGPSGAGKTHLVHVWAAQSDARIISARDITRYDIPTLANGNVAVEDVPMIAGNSEAEQALFHLHNLVLAEGHALLLTAPLAPNRWALKLPDLASRMMGTQMVVLEGPDDALLLAVLMKLFADRQLSPTPDTLPYLVRRIDRSFEAVHRVVSALDAAALDQQRPINRVLAAQVLGQINGS
jgi:chromosomal replication initiation ATPase DnaA